VLLLVEWVLGLLLVLLVVVLLGRHAEVVHLDELAGCGRDLVDYELGLNGHAHRHLDELLAWDLRLLTAG
jgi:hypothetical protein